MASSLSRPASVLVIEDNMDAADSLTRFLRVAAGHKVRVAYDGTSGIRMAQEDPPDVVLCDIALPKQDGYAVARQVISSLPGKPLMVAVTAFGGEHPEDKAKAAGFDFYLAKPADPFVIDSLIREHLRAILSAVREGLPPKN